MKMDELARRLASLGVPGLVLVAAMALNGFAGAAALTAALAMLGGPFGMLGGIGVLLLLSTLSDLIAQRGAESVARAVIGSLIRYGKSISDIEKEIDKMPISKALKPLLREWLRKNQDNPGTSSE